MSLRLHPNALARLVELTEAALPRIQTFEGRSFAFFTTPQFEAADKALKVKGQVREDLESWISETPFGDFISHTINKRRSRSGAKEESPSFTGARTMQGVALTTLPEYSDPRAAAVRLVNEFDALPVQCSYLLPLPKQGDLAVADTDLGGGFSVRGAYSVKEFAKSLKSSGALPRGFLEFRTPGFVGAWPKTNTDRRALSAAASFYGCLIAVGALRPEGFVDDWGFGSSHNLVSHEQANDGTWVAGSVELMPSVLSGVISRLRSADTPQESMKLWRKVGNVFSQPKAHRRILPAAEWLLDSYSGGDELLAYVQAMVALEMLVGDKARSDLLGLGELLSNRVAYLLGKSHSDREEILTTFGQIYEVRSNIVHAGKKRLRGVDRQRFQTLQRYCNEVLAAEIGLLEEDLLRVALAAQSGPERTE